MDQGDFIFYADESGDHSLTSIDPTYPIFALSICAFKKSIYCRKIVPAFQEFKFRHFGHDLIILHEHEIRKQAGAFRLLANLPIRESFLNDLNELMMMAKFHLFGCVIDKRILQYHMFPDNPYSVALRVCLQNIYRFMRLRKQFGRASHFVFEKRGLREDRDLELEFRRIVSGDNELSVPFTGFHIHFSDKRANSTGMQIADLTARPIGLSVIRPHQHNRAMEIMRPKIFPANGRFSKPEKGIFVP